MAKDTSSDNSIKHKHRKDTAKIVINVPIGNNQTVEFIDDYNLLDLSVSQAMNMPEFINYYNLNCNNVLKKRMDSLIHNDVALSKYTNAEANTFCKCSLNKLGSYKIRDILDQEKRSNIQISDCVKDTINSVKTRLTKKNKMKDKMKDKIKKTTRRQKTHHKTHHKTKK
jgi:hypothetical protein